MTTINNLLSIEGLTQILLRQVSEDSRLDAVSVDALMTDLGTNYLTSVYTKLNLEKLEPR